MSESECYARLYGGRDTAVEVIRGAGADRPEGGLLGEQLRQLIEQRVDQDEAGRLPEAEAA